MPTVLLGEFLVAKGLITKLQLEEALQTQRVFAGKKLGELLVEQGFLTPEGLEQALAMQQLLRGTAPEAPVQERKGGYLREIPLLKELSDDELRELTGLCRMEIFERGHFIFVEGEDGEAVYFLASGAVRLAKANPRGGEEELGVAAAGDIFGEAEMLDDGQRTLTAYVQMDSACLALGKQEFDGLLERNPALGIRLYRIFARRVAQRLRDALAKHVTDAIHLRSGKGFV